MPHQRHSEHLRPVHLVGSVPLRSAEEVFTVASAELGDHLRRIPDGETGDRAGWIGFQVPLLAAHPDLVRDLGTGHDTMLLERAERAEGSGYQRPTFRLRAGADPAAVRFDDLGYARAAIGSYAVFARLKAAGVISGRTRFQVSLPTPLAPLVVFAAPGDVAALLPGYRRAMLAELTRILTAVPVGELAVQWDVAAEIALLEGAFTAQFDDVAEVVAQELVELGDSVPEGVELGYHFCYGDFGHEHFVEPRDLTVPVALAGAVAAGLRRRLDFVHMPVPRERDDSAYFAPLQALDVPASCELHLGLVHATDGLAGARRRLAAASRYRAVFGVAAECGFGRRDPDAVVPLLHLHREVSSASGAPDARSDLQEKT